MDDNFCAFILSHGRPDRVLTYRTLRRRGYTGKIYIVIDDEDDTAERYHANFGDQVLVFNKDEIALKTDLGDNFDNRISTIYVRNAFWELARKVGVKYFIQLDDDYTDFRFKRDADFNFIDGRDIKNLDKIFGILLRFLIKTPATSVAIAQGGDFIGGKNGGVASIGLLRKCMNSFICSVDRPFSFVGTLNEDVNTYCHWGKTGSLFFTVTSLGLQQAGTQQHSGGMTGSYSSYGTYTKSFYTVMFCPSSVRVMMMITKFRRIHHQIKWVNTVPMIISEKHKKTVRRK